MKFSAAKLKNLNYKQLLINHGEKLALGLVAAIVLLVLWGSRWGTFQGDPEDLKRQVNDAKNQLAQSKWDTALKQQVYWASAKVEEVPKVPEDARQKVAQAQSRLTEQGIGPEAQTFAAQLSEPTIRDRVEQLFVGLEGAPYFYRPGEELWVPIVNPAEPSREPKWFAVEQPKAQAGSFLLVTADSAGEDGEMVAEAGEGGAKAAQGDLTDAEREAMERFGVGAENTGTGAAATGHGTSPPGGHQVAGPSQYRPPGGQSSAGTSAGHSGSRPTSSGHGGGAGMYGGGMADYMGSVQADHTGATGRGVRYVVVTGVFPFQRQLNEIFKAVSNPQVDQSQLLDIVDFEIQRQTAQAGPEPWSDRDEDWKTVDVQAALDVFGEAADFDIDVIPSSYLHPVITWPLPARGIGRWLPQDVSHPSIRKHLTDQERAAQALIDELAAQQAQEERQSGAGGAALIQRDLSSARRQALTSGRSQFMTQLSTRMGGESQSANMYETQYGSLLSAQSDVTLFRYFDFEVNPGEAYRYRVRLKFSNPSFGQTVSVDPVAAEGKFRQSPWSEPTPPVVVPQDVRYFLVDATPPRGRSSAPRAALKVFQWFADEGLGTWSEAELKDVEPGQFIGQLVDAYILRPLTPSLEKEPQRFQTGDVLVDLDAAPQELGSDHKELGLSREQMAALASADQALVADEFGRLRAIDPVARADQRQRMETLVKYQNMAYEPIKDGGTKQASESSSGLQQFIEGSSAGHGNGEGGGHGGKEKKGKKKSPLRRRAPTET